VLVTRQEGDHFLACETRFSQERHQRSFGQVAIVGGNYRSTAGDGIAEDVMAARSMIHNKAILFQESNDLARLDGWQFRHDYFYTK
jgi:hypothetical protein